MTLAKSTACAGLGGRIAATLPGTSVRREARRSHTRKGRMRLPGGRQAQAVLTHGRDGGVVAQRAQTRAQA